MNIVRLGLIACLALPLGACIETNMQGYADLQAPSASIRNLAAFVIAPPNVAPGMQASIRSEAAKRGIVAEDIQDLLPPTRQYTADQVKSILHARGVDAVLVISIGDSGIQNQYIGTFISGSSTSSFTGNATVVRNGPFANVSMAGTSQSSGFAVAQPIYRASRSTTFHAKLIEVTSGRTLWVGQGETDSSGLLFVGMNGSKSISSIFNDLQAKRIIAPAGA